MAYAFEAYDVLQINIGGEWKDFSTLRTEAEGERAVTMVNLGQWDGHASTFRIVGMNKRTVKHERVVVDLTVAAARTTKAPKNLTNAQRAALEVLAAHLDVNSPNFSGSEKVRDALSSIDSYMQSWVLPVLAMLKDGEQWHGQAEDVKREAARLTK